MNREKETVYKPSSCRLGIGLHLERVTNINRYCVDFDRKCGEVLRTVPRTTRIFTVESKEGVHDVGFCHKRPDCRNDLLPGRRERKVEKGIRWRVGGTGNY